MPRNRSIQLSRRQLIKGTAAASATLLLGIVDVAGKYYLPEAGAFLIYVFMIVMLLVRPNGIVAKKGLA